MPLITVRRTAVLIYQIGTFFQPEGKVYYFMVHCGKARREISVPKNGRDYYVCKQIAYNAFKAELEYSKCNH